jgi:hypothetical protein
MRRLWRGWESEMPLPRSLSLSVSLSFRLMSLPDCDGDGKITCPTCRGAGNLRRHAVVHRIHEVLNNYSVVDSIPDSELPPHLITAANGIEILNVQAMNIAPPQGFSPDLDAALVQLDITATNQTIAKSGLLSASSLSLSVWPEP